MFDKYYLFWSVKNMNGGESSDKAMFDTLVEAEDKFFDKLSTIGGNPQTQAMWIELRDGNMTLVRELERKRPLPTVEPAEEA